MRVTYVTSGRGSESIERVDMTGKCRQNPAFIGLGAGRRPGIRINGGIPRIGSPRSFSGIAHAWPATFDDDRVASAI